MDFLLLGLLVAMILVWTALRFRRNKRRVKWNEKGGVPYYSKDYMDTMNAHFKRE